MILYPIGGGDVKLLAASACMRFDERSPFPASTNVPLSFWDIAERANQLNLGTLIGWRRAHRRTRPPNGGRRHSNLGSAADFGALAVGGLKRVGHLVGGNQAVQRTASNTNSSKMFNVELNPTDKGRQLLWCDKDELILLASQGGHAGSQVGSSSSHGDQGDPPRVPPPVLPTGPLGALEA